MYAFQSIHRLLSLCLQALIDAGIKSADSVVIAGIASSNLTPQDADSCTMAILLQVQEAIHASGRTSPPHIVARLREKSNCSVLSLFLDSYKQGLTDSLKPALIKCPDILQVEQLISDILAFSTFNSCYLPVADQLLNTSSGAEIYLRAPEDLGLSKGEAISFNQVAEHARILKETAIGYQLSNGTSLLTPGVSHTTVFQPGDKVVVMAETY